MRIKLFNDTRLTNIISQEKILQHTIPAIAFFVLIDWKIALTIKNSQFFRDHELTIESLFGDLRN